MNNQFIKKWGGYVVAVVLFVALSVAFFYPIVLEDKTLVQYDIKSGIGWGKDARDYHERTGDYVHWSNMMFSGMPANYTYMPQSPNIFKSIGRVLVLDNMGNWGLLFLYMLGFYILLISLGCSNWLSVIGAVAYAFCSYNLVIIDAGHISKGLVMATMAPIIGGVILCYRGKYIWGAIITLLFTGLNIAWAHQQISYYLLLTLVILFVVYLVYAVREKTMTQFAKSSAVLVVAALLAIAPSLGSLLPTMDYAKETMRGGSVLKANVDGKKESSGLELDYAYQWSYGKMETFTLLIPNFAGGSSTYKIGKNTETYKALLPTGQAAQYAQSMPMYWAGNQYKTFTSGTVYAGAIICFLFVLGLIIVRRQEKWWILAATLLSFVLAWGRNLYGVNEFLFHHLPLYNKFRTPEMALVIANMAMVVLAALAVKELTDNYKTKKQEYLKALYISGGIVGGICLLFALFGGSMFDFTSNADQNMPDWLRTALVADRKAMLSGDAWRSFAFIALAACAIYFFIRKNFDVKYLFAILGVLIFIDLWAVDRRFIYEDKFVAKHKSQEFVPSAADAVILQDKDLDYRVFNLAVSTFNESNTSYFHKSVGGYSPAKLRRYQDIIDFYLGNPQEMSRLMNEIITAQCDFGKISPNAFPVINMLNTRYLIMPSQNGEIPLRNPYALGNAWFVDSIRWVDSADEEILAIGKIDPRTTAVVDKAQQSKIQAKSAINKILSDTVNTIKLTEYIDPGHLVYESVSDTEVFAVFSEIYYKTWRAYIDGKEVPIVRADYILRGLLVPPGVHKIEFKCRDEVIVRSHTYALIGSIAVGIVFAALIGLLIYRRNKKGENL